MTTIGPYLLLGVLVGVCSGLIGVGGGVIIVPALVYLFGTSQAQGTTIAMLERSFGLLRVMIGMKMIIGARG